jgi:protein subunit release factor A
MAREKLFSVTIKDCRVEFIASTGGGGGQNKNRRHTACRITHEPSGAVGYSADEREQLRNKVCAFGRMARSKEFQRWLKLEASRRLAVEPIETVVEREMQPENIRTEVRVDGKWTQVQALQFDGSED